MKYPGFTLVEVLVATLVASLLSMFLMAALYEINRIVPIVDQAVIMNEDIALVHAQLERDFSGVTAPVEWYVRKPKNGQKPSSQAEEEENEEEEGSDMATKAKRPLEKLFYSQNKQNMFDHVTFITTNPLNIYWSAKVGSAKPRVVRVRYLVKEETGGKRSEKSYVLVRQESPKLDYAALNNKEVVKEYEVLHNIQSITASYTAVIEEQAEGQVSAKKEAAAKEKKKREIKKVAEWVEKKESEENTSTKMPPVPRLAEYTITLWDTKQKKSRTYILTLRIPAEIAQERKESSRLLGKLKELTEKTGMVGEKPPAQSQKTSPGIAKR